MNDLACRKSILVLLAVAACALSGCSTWNVFDRRADYGLGHSHPTSTGEVRIVRGKPRPVIDGLGRVFGIPNQIALGDRRVDNHSVSRETEEYVAQYLQDQQLGNVLVRVNQYDPLGEWRRLVANKDIRPIWKLTAGNYSLLKYTLLPGRITGGDWYNPFSNSLHLYSDVAPLAVSKAAYAQDIQSRINRGAYGAMEELPVLGLQHETAATKLAIDWYAAAHPDRLDKAEAVLYPNYGASWGGHLGAFVPYGDVLGRLAGGLAGQAANAVRK